MNDILKRIASDVAWAIAIAVTIGAIAGARPSKTSDQTVPDSVLGEQRLAAHRTQLRERVRVCLGSEVRFANSHAKADETRVSVESVRRFVALRAAVTLDDSVADKLVEMERSTLAGESRRITVDDLATVVTGMAVERFRTVSDDEILSAAEGFLNIRATGEPVDRARSGLAGSEEFSSEDIPWGQLTFRVDGEGGSLSREDFVEHMKEVRARLNTSPEDRAMAVFLGPEVMRDAIAKRLDEIGSGLPSGGAEGLTPVEAFLLTYSLASDDELDFTTVDLDCMTQRLLSEENRTPNGPVTPYGRGGVFFSTPLDLAFNRDTLAAFLDRLEARSRL